MNVMSHFLMPVVAAGIYDEIYCRKNGAYRFKIDLVLFITAYALIRLSRLLKKRGAT